jgi:rRNA maturation endonuclease Nob1
MIEQIDNPPHICYNCEAEFVVHTPYNNEDTVSFCPFCGSEVDPTEDELDFTDDDE